MKTRDKDIRDFLHINIKNQYINEPGTIVVDELSLCQGNARIDIAVVNGSMHGYEIKSESDTLERLPNQINIYNQVMDTITIVTGPNHLNKVKELVPKWWGITVAKLNSNNNMESKIIRKTKQNPNVNAMALAQLLWRDEAIQILEEVNLIKGYKGKSRRVLRERLANSLSLEETKYYVRRQLKSRKDWRADQL
jgi:hypothetical protein